MTQKTPFIKGFNWPSTQYRLCFINFKYDDFNDNNNNNNSNNNNNNKYDNTNTNTNTNTKSTHSIFLNTQCFIISCIITSILKSGFTSL